MGIVVEHLDIEVGIGGHEVEHIAFPHIRPVFPTYVPAFYQHLVETVLGGEVDVALHVLVVGLVGAVGLYLTPVDLIEFDRGEVVGVMPGTTSYDHLPPHAAVLRGMDPGGILQLTGLVQVQDEAVREHVTGIVRYHHRAPGRLTGCLHRTLQTSGVRCEMTHKCKHLRQGIRSGLRIGGIYIAATHQFLGEVLGVGIHEFEMHRGIVLTGSLMDVDIQAVVALHLERGLHTCLREHGH